ncbi:hypothetical protein Agabi119p4_3122 [Agaricus bisporus var. burnettii]|uniref:Uncharacterized protein n=1 Tax=Agaricus bisporus var. burnettii TaxID=192524 RepID=A0A8H7KIV0_AGABI|nr:hypothetical protein Agabi119p4_3122 [Agaricus bisporus var. burnettii]
MTLVLRENFWGQVLVTGITNLHDRWEPCVSNLQANTQIRRIVSSTHLSNDLHIVTFVKDIYTLSREVCKTGNGYFSRIR